MLLFGAGDLLLKTGTPRAGMHLLRQNAKSSTFPL
jgi:hypothetical protein